MVQRQLQAGNDGSDLILVLITVAVVAGGMAILLCCGCACCWGFRLQIRQLLFRDASQAADDVVSDTVVEERPANNTATVPNSPVPPSVSIAVDAPSGNIRNNMSRTQISRVAQSHGHRAEKPTPPPRQGHREEKREEKTEKTEKTRREEKREEKTEKAASPSHVTPRTLSRTNSGYARPQTPRARETTLARARR